MKDLYIWGTGNICNMCLQYNLLLQPKAFIDINKQINTFKNLKVYHPDDITDFEDKFILIAVVSYGEVEKYLKNKKLIKGIHYNSYKEYLGNDCSWNDFFIKINKLLLNKRDIDTVVYFPEMMARGASNRLNFTKKYLEKNSKESLVLASLDVVDELNAAKLFNTDVLALPNNISFTESKNSEWLNSLDKEEWLEDNVFFSDLFLEIYKSNPKNLNIAKKIYSFVYKIIDLIKPKKILVWNGGWSCFALSFQYVAEINNIQFNFIEHGFIPGTYAVDCTGFFGKNTASLRCIDKKNYTGYDIKGLVRYITEYRLDSGIFRETEKDMKQLSCIDNKKKTVFYVGAGINNYLFESGTDFWKKNISNLFNSSDDAARYIYNICKEEELNFIYKPHPHSLSDSMIENWRQLDNVAIVTDSSIDTLIMKADVVVSLASAVDFKVMMYNKPLISLGHNVFEQKNCCYPVDKVSNINNIIKVALNSGMTKDQIASYYHFLDWLLVSCLWDDLTHPDFKYGLTFDKDFFD